MNTSSKTKEHSVKIVKRGPGRPSGDKKVAWSKANLLWKNKTTKEIAEILDCSVPAVHIHRKKLIKAGKDVACKKPRYTRAVVK